MQDKGTGKIQDASGEGGGGVWVRPAYNRESRRREFATDLEGGGGVVGEGRGGGTKETSGRKIVVLGRGGGRKRGGDGV